jgi:hypothetical protein
MKYRVGDKVRVISGLVVDGAYGNWAFTEKMKKYKGKSVTISEVCQDYYRIKEDEEYGYCTDEMFESVEGMSAEEAIRLYAKMCKDNNCYACPVYEKSGECGCEEFAINHPEEVIESLKQWKADHEKKPIETEFIWYLLVVEEKTHIVKYEKPLKIERERTTDEQKEELLREWCSEHDGKYYVTTERRCVVKE